MLLADADLATGRVTMAQAGHPCPAIQRADGRVEIEGPGGLPVGLIDGATYERFDVQLYPGDRLLLHSDGVDECADGTGKLLGEDGVRRILQELRQTEGMAFLESVIWKLAEYAGRDDFDDDVSAALLEFKPVGKVP
jgi:sigma-B regulation protein RsbU (phosphoserine phosphatase)